MAPGAVAETEYPPLREERIETFEHSIDAGQNAVGGLLTDDGDGRLTGSSSAVDQAREKILLSRWNLRYSIAVAATE